MCILSPAFKRWWHKPGKGWNVKTFIGRHYEELPPLSWHTYDHVRLERTENNYSYENKLLTQPRGRSKILIFLLPKASSRRPAAAWQQARRKTAQEKAGQHNRMAQEKDEDAADQCARQCQKEREMWDSASSDKVMQTWSATEKRPFLPESIKTGLTQQSTIKLLPESAEGQPSNWHHVAPVP